MISQQITDNMTTATAAWVTAAALELDEDRMNVFKRCTEMGGADIRVTVALRAGTLFWTRSLRRWADAPSYSGRTWTHCASARRSRRRRAKASIECALAVTRARLGGAGLLGWSRAPGGQNAFCEAKTDYPRKIF